MSDLVQRLRDSVTQCRALDRSQLLEEAADEIASLRLTDAELEAIRFFSLIDGPSNVPVANKRAATLRGLLERLA